MTKLVIFLTEGFADWETAHLAATARGWYGVEVVHTTLNGDPVTSAGGMTVQPALPLVGALDGADALVLCGGTAWRTNPPEISPVLHAFHGPICAICDATRGLAKAGLLDVVSHTSNDAETLADVADYKGAAHFTASPLAVRDGRIITAPGTAPVSFMAEVLAAVGLADDNLRFYRGLLATEHQAA
jgi:putative intracellular protease/amidase